jgi:hypothetical protein
MAKALIKLAYRQEISEASIGGFESKVFHASYEEFLLKSQAYNLEGKYRTFSQLKASDGRANSLHYKLSFAAGHFISALNNKTPGLKDNAGNSPAFEEARFELMESDILDAGAHRVAIHYQTRVLTLLDTIEDYLILAVGDTSENDASETFTLKMQPGLSIVYYKRRNILHDVLSYA